MSKEFENPCIEVSVLSVQESEFTNKDTGERRKMWRVYAADPTGAVGSVWSTIQYFPGDIIRLELAVSVYGQNCQIGVSLRGSCLFLWHGPAGAYLISATKCRH